LILINAQKYVLNDLKKMRTRNLLFFFNPDNYDE